MATTAPAQTVAGVERALDVLTLFAAHAGPDLGVTEIADRLDLSKAVVHRILASFRVKGFVDLDEGSRRYRLGAAALDLGLSYLNRIDVMSEARRELHTLCQQTDETATLSVRAGWNRVYVDQVTPLRDIKMVVQIGGSYPLHAGSSGKALLAFLPAELRDAYLGGGSLHAVTEITITDPDALRVELDEIRERGYAASLGERQPGAASVAAPVLDHAGLPVVGVSVCGPIDRFRDELDRCADALCAVTTALSARLGFRTAS